MKRIGADNHIGMFFGDRTQDGRPIRLRGIRPYICDSILVAGFQIRRDEIKHRLHDLGHPGHHDDIADLEARAADVEIRLSSAPSGVRVMRMRASFKSVSPL